MPVLAATDSILCPVAVLKHYIKSSGRKGSDPLFVFTYSSYNSKSLCKHIGLVGHYSTHSVRRGSASYLATFMPIDDVKAYGDWRSWAVLLCLSDGRKSKDCVVAEQLSKYTY